MFGRDDYTRKHVVISLLYSQNLAPRCDEIFSYCF